MAIKLGGGGGEGLNGRGFKNIFFGASFPNVDRNTAHPVPNS